MTYAGVVRSQGSYADRIDSLYVAFHRADAEVLPYREHTRVRITLQIGTRRYVAGLRTTPAQSIVYMYPDLLGAPGDRVRLADALHENGFERNGRIVLHEARDEYRLREING